MTWYKNRTMYFSALWGGGAGIVFVIVGMWLETQNQNLPFSFWSILYIQRTQPLIWIVEFAPLVLGFMAGLMGKRRSLLSVISQARNEWEVTFDAFSDPIFITDKDGYIIRCNHAALDRLNSTRMKILGRQVSDVLSEGQQEKNEGVSYSESELLWFKRIYDMSTCPINTEGVDGNIIYILHDITERVQSNEQLRKLSRARGDEVNE